MFVWKQTAKFEDIYYLARTNVKLPNSAITYLKDHIFEFD